MAEFDTTEQLDPDQEYLKLQLINYQLDSNPLNPELWFNKASIYETLMDGIVPDKVRLERSLLWYKQCSHSWSLIWAVYFNSALILRKLNRFEEALELIKKACDLNPSEPSIWSLLVSIFRRLGFYNEANVALKKAHDNGIDLEPQVIQFTKSGETIYKNEAFIPNLDDELTKDTLKNNNEKQIEKILQGKIPFVIEASDPELVTLQFELSELQLIGLKQVAENLCILFQTLKGSNALTSSTLAKLKTFNTENDFEQDIDLASISDLLEIAFRYPNIKYLSIVNKLFKLDKYRKLINISEVEKLNILAEQQIDCLKEIEFNINTPKTVFGNKPSHQLQILWNITILNFLVANKLCNPLLISHTSITLAKFYEKLGKSNLPFILYRNAVINSEGAKEYDYCVEAIIECANILMNKKNLGAAISYLRHGLKFVNNIKNLNRFLLYSMLGECYQKIFLINKAKSYFASVIELEDVPSQLLHEIKSVLNSLNDPSINKTTILKPLRIVKKSLEVKRFEFHIFSDTLMFEATSKHELYDSLLEFFDNLSQFRYSLFEREQGIKFNSSISQLTDLLVELAIELKLNYNALIHLESKKSNFLNNRLKYLLVDKPHDIPLKQWEELHQLISLYRRIVEKEDIEIYEDNDPIFYSVEEVVNGIRSKLWHISKVSGKNQSKIKQKLAYDEFPIKINSIESHKTLILEYFCGENKGACFIVDPNDPSNPEVIELPKATTSECEKLIHILYSLIQEWTNVLTSPIQSNERLDFQKQSDFILNLNDIFYKPLIKKLKLSEVEAVCIIPHRAMHILPLNLLGYSSEEAALGDRVNLSFAPSLLILNNIHSTGTWQPKKSLIVANPIPKCPDEICRNIEKNCYSIDRAEEEGAYIKSLMDTEGINTTYLSGQTATRESVIKNIQGAEIIHFACHGYFNEYKPEDSGLLLSLDKLNEDEESVFFLHNSNNDNTAVSEILTLKQLWNSVDMFDCKFLNLSACSTAQINWKERADEFYGLNNGFLYAGVQSILSVLWPLLDFASEVFNKIYYNELLRNSYKPALSLRSAIKKFRELSDDEIRILSSNSKSNHKDKSSVNFINDLLIRINKLYYNNNAKPFSHPFFWAGYRILGVPN